MERWKEYIRTENFKTTGVKVPQENLQSGKSLNAEDSDSSCLASDTDDIADPIQPSSSTSNFSAATMNYIPQEGHESMSATDTNSAHGHDFVADHDPLAF